MDFEDFLTANLGRLGRYAGVLVGDRQLAHDVLAQTLIAIWPIWDRVGAMQYPLAYVRAAVTTTFLDHRRTTLRRRTFSTSSHDLLDSRIDSVIDHVEDRDELDGLLRALPDRQRTVLVLRYYLDRTDQQIAAELGCALSTVRSSANRGLASLRLAKTSARE
ncbi:RNA polymerase sigma factor (sigma-70 family) [Nakamurella sp. UYEF19]|uniref:sigma-70 family RNA polymerase sigma factor n=1 Tax=Nakamurella sp. UYEF19 TaxID=1756392 RepID=UPI003399E412